MPLTVKSVVNRNEPKPQFVISAPGGNLILSPRLRLHNTGYDRLILKSRTDQLPTGRVGDPNWFNADPDPAFFLIAVRIPDPGSGFDDLKLKKNLQLEIFIFIFLIKNCNLIIQGRPSYRRSLQPAKENIQHFKTWRFCIFFYFCG
jgi:hypothetical protein